METFFDTASVSAELRETLSGFLKKHHAKLMQYLTTDQIQLLQDATEDMWIGEDLKLHFSNSKTLNLLREMEFGSRTMPRFEVITMLNEIVNEAEAAREIDEIMSFWDMVDQEIL